MRAVENASFLEAKRALMWEKFNAESFRWSAALADVCCWEPPVSQAWRSARVTGVLLVADDTAENLLRTA